MQKKQIYILFLCFSFCGYAWVTWNVIKGCDHRDMLTPCMFKQVTHIPCPSCGATRSLIYLINHGDVTQAFLINPIGIVLFIAMLIIPFWIIVDILLKSSSFYRAYQYMETVLKQKRWLSVSLISVVLINWVWNIVKGL